MLWCSIPKLWSLYINLVDNAKKIMINGFINCYTNPSIPKQYCIIVVLLSLRFFSSFFRFFVRPLCSGLLFGKKRMPLFSFMVCKTSNKGSTDILHFFKRIMNHHTMLVWLELSASINVEAEAGYRSPFILVIFFFFISIYRA